MHDSAWTGEYHLDGRARPPLDKKRAPELQKRNIGFVFQSYHLLDDLTVYENLEIPLSYRDVKKTRAPGHRRRHPRPLRDRGQEGPLPEPALGRPAAARGAWRARSSPTRSSSSPTSPRATCTPSQAREIMELFKQLNEEGTTIIQVTHSEANAAFGDRVVKLQDGWIVDDAGSSDVEAAPRMTRARRPHPHRRRPARRARGPAPAAQGRGLRDRDRAPPRPAVMARAGGARVRRPCSSTSTTPATRPRARKGSTC